MRFPHLNAPFNRFTGPAHQWAVSNDQSAVRISNILRCSFRVTAIDQFDDGISVSNFAIFGPPTGGAPTAATNAKFQRRIQRAAINAGLPARNYLKRSRLDQLQPWLVPHSVQTPQAPARITFSLPQCEQVISINIFPSAAFTRSAWV